MACGECEPIGCLNDKCNDWSPTEPDWSNCENLHPDEIKKCAFYLDDPDTEWIKVKRRKLNNWKSKIPWDKLQYDYVARDDDGCWWNYESRPTCHTFIWQPSDHHYSKISTGMPQGPKDFRDTLAVRPGSLE